MTPFTLANLRFAALVVAFVALLATSPACSDSQSANPATGQQASTTGSVDSNSPEDVARLAVQALIDGDDVRFLDLVRPDQAKYATPDNLRGCDLGRAQVLVEEPFEGRPGQARVTIVFGEACGASVTQSQPFKVCYMDLVKLSGGWYLEATSHCAIV
jgi:hypothetical protein